MESEVELLELAGLAGLVEMAGLIGLVELVKLFGPGERETGEVGSGQVLRSARWLSSWDSRR